MKLIIQIPCFNEEASLPTTLNALPQSLPGVDQIEWLVVDDGSQDRTVEVAKQHGVHHLVVLDKHEGLGIAFQAGLEYAVAHGADIILNFDADYQYPAENIEPLLRPILAGQAGVVLGCRPLEQLNYVSRLKKILYHVGNTLVSLLSGQSVPDVTTGLRAFSRQAAQEIHLHNPYTHTVETLFIVGRKKISLLCVPATCREVDRPSRLFRWIPAYLFRMSGIILLSCWLYRRGVLLGGLALLLGVIGAIVFLNPT